VRKPSIILKYQRKFLGLIGRFIHLNLRYRPLGVVKVRDLDPSVQYIEINPPYVSKLCLDEAFLHDCAENLRPELSVAYPGDYLVVLEKGRTFTAHDAHIAFITSNSMLVDEISFQWERERGMLAGAENQAFSARVIVGPRKYEGTVFSLLSGGGAKHYYYHWLFDSIPKFDLLRKSGLAYEIDYFLVPSVEHKYQIEYLKKFGIRDDQIIDSTEVQHLIADRLVVASYTRLREHLPRWVCSYLHEIMVDKRQPRERNELIYIARGDAQRNRKVINEDCLIRELVALGFHVYYLTRFSIYEQAELFNSAAMVVASHGGGLSNLVFCEPGTPVIEFFPDNYVNHLFYDVCRKSDLSYHYLVCPSEKSNENELQAETNLVAEVPAIVDKVKEVLGTINRPIPV
jgi:hypothetical protein